MSEINFSVEKDSAEIWRRIAALVYDSFMLLAISMAFGALVVIVSTLMGYVPDDSYTPVANGSVVFPLWWFVLAFFYYYFWRKDGQTIGMRAWRLRLVGFDGEPVSRKSCVVRTIISPLVIGLFLFGYFWKFVDKDNLCLQDRLSKTRVVVVKKHK